MAKLSEKTKFGPGPIFGRSGSCTPSSSSRGAFGSSVRAMKTESYKPGKRVKGDDDESSSGGTGVMQEGSSRDFPGDIAPAGFGGGEGKKSTLWRTNAKGKYKYAGQSKKGFSDALPASKNTERAIKRQEKENEEKGTSLDMTKRVMPKPLQDMIIKKITERKSLKK